jgi:hypothetical protein
MRQSGNKPGVSSVQRYGIDHIHLRIKREADMADAPTIVGQPLVMMFKDEDGRSRRRMFGNGWTGNGRSPRPVCKRDAFAPN